MSVEHDFERALPLIQRVVTGTCRRHRLSREDAEDFASWVSLRLLESDAAMLRRFRGRSSLRTYLAAVVNHLFLDYRNARWGRWRPSAAARRAGPDGIDLDILLHRDGRPLAEAIEILSARGCQRSRAELEALAARLRPRVPRRHEGIEGLGAVPSTEPSPFERARRLSDAPRARRLQRSLRGALEAHPEEDRAILGLRFGEGMKVVDIARLLGLEQRPLYDRVERLLRGLRRRLEADGFSAREVIELLRWSDLDLDFGLDELQSTAASSRRERRIDRREVFGRVRLPT